jgi:hypothetical protein
MKLVSLFFACIMLLSSFYTFGQSRKDEFANFAEKQNDLFVGAYDCTLGTSGHFY